MEKVIDLAEFAAGELQKFAEFWRFDACDLTGKPWPKEQAAESLRELLRSLGDKAAKLER